MSNEVQIPTWIIHAVPKDGKLVFHTHGLIEYDSLELELNLPLNQSQAMKFINIVGLGIANGLNLKDGDFDSTLFSCQTAFKEVDGIHGDGERNLRIIFPDTNYTFPWEEGCQEPYKSQI